MGFLDNTRPLMDKISMVCPCGAPLQLFKIECGEMVKREEWVIGHPECKQSPGIHGANFAQVAFLLLRTLLKYKRLSTREEHLAETDKDLLTYNIGADSPVAWRENMDVALAAADISVQAE